MRANFELSRKNRSKTPLQNHEFRLPRENKSNFRITGNFIRLILAMIRYVKLWYVLTPTPGDLICKWCCEAGQAVDAQFGRLE